MARLLQSILLVFAVLDVVMAVYVFLSQSRKQIDNILFTIFAMSGAVWSFSFGLLLVQESAEAAYLCRTFGLIGTFCSFVSGVMLCTYWANASVTMNRIVNLLVIAGVIICPLSILRRNASFIMTDFGMSYVLSTNIYNNIYNAYCYILAATMLILLLITTRRSNKRRVRKLGKYMLAELLIMIVGSLFDTLLPAFGYTAIPSSSLAEFFAIVVIFYALRYINLNRQTISSISGHILHSVKLSVLVYNDQGRLVIVSDEAGRKLALEDAANSYLSPQEIFELDENPLVSCEDYSTISARDRKTGHIFDLDINVLRDNFKDVTGYVIVAYDATERLDFIARLNDEKERADKANIAKTAFLANMSHEIRTPINTVLGMNEMIRRETGSSVILGYSENIKNAGEALLALINDILDFSKVEAGKTEIIEADYSLSKMLTNLSSMFELKCSEKGLQFKLEIDENLPCGLYGDEIRIRQILMNLLTNAVKYTRQGSVTFRVSGTMEADSNIKICFGVIDTGIGIKKENIGLLFNSFTRFDKEYTKAIEGTGLGLSIVKRLVELMDANIEVNSVYGEGSEFTLTIMQKVVDLVPIGAVQVGAEPVQSQQARYKASFIAPDASVLVVDDNKMNLEVIKGLLKKTKVQLDLALSGRECIEMATSKRYDIIFLDHMMPEMDGIETLKALRELPDEANLSHAATVIALTANAIHGVREMYISNGFDEYLSKPIDSEKLEDAIMRFLPQDMLKEAENEPVEETENTQPTGQDALKYKIMEALGTRRINPIKGLEFCGDIDIYRLTALTFVQNSGEMMQKLAQFRAAKDIDNYRILIHSVKSNALTLGCLWLHELALKQEESCKAGAFEPILKSGDVPEKQIGELCTSLKEAFELTAEECGEAAGVQNGQLGAQGSSGAMSGDTSGIKGSLGAMSGDTLGIKGGSESMPGGSGLRPFVKGEALGILNTVAGLLEEFDDESAIGALGHLLQMELPAEAKSLAEEGRQKCKMFDYDAAAECVTGAIDVINAV